jgi:thiol:disulfide interchange protein DsbC
MKKTILAACVLSVMAAVAQAGEAEIRKAVEGRIGKVEKLSKSPLPGMWEAIVDNQVFYVEESGQYLLAGNLVDLRNGKNLTAERQFGLLPLDLALKQVRGSGKNVLVTFEDPNCGYCKKLAKELVKVKNVTVYTFLYPVLGDDSFEKSKAIWCSADRMKTWNDWMLNGKSVGTAPEKCDLKGLEATIALGQKMRINGTPALVFGNGERLPGYIPAEEIEKRFAAGS